MDKKWTLEKIKREVARMDPKLKRTDDEFKSGVLLLASVIVGPGKAGAFTGYDARFITPRAKRLRENGIWKRGKVRHSGWFEDGGGVAFWMDVCVAEGLIQRSPAEA